MSPETARRLLQLPSTATPTDVDRSFRRLACVLHPDRGGDTDTFRRLLQARMVLHEVQSDTRTPRPPLIVVHRGPWWRRLTRALCDAVQRRRDPPSPRVS